MNKEFDRVEVINSPAPNYPYTKTNYFLNNEIVKKTFVDEEEDKTEYFKHGQLHRENEPAVVTKDGSGFHFEYFQNGQLHRKDGPAIIFVSYPSRNKWYIEGKELSNVEIAIQKMKNIRDNVFTNSSKNKPSIN